MKKFIALAITLLFLAGILLGFGLGFLFPEETIDYNEVHMNLPAVRADGKGMLAEVVAVVKPGQGRVLVSVNDVLAGFETQESARIASLVASNFTGKRLDHVDLIYSIRANASSIDGPSAGAALTVTTIAALEKKQLNRSVMMTGTIKENGEIGKASGVEAKIGASKDVGARLFLVSTEQDLNNHVQKEQICEEIGSINYCRIDYVEAQNFSLPVERVRNIEEAWGYFV